MPRPTAEELGIPDLSQISNSYPEGLTEVVPATHRVHGRVRVRRNRFWCTDLPGPCLQPSDLATFTEVCQRVQTLNGSTGLAPLLVHAAEQDRILPTTIWPAASYGVAPMHYVRERFSAPHAAGATAMVGQGLQALRSVGLTAIPRPSQIQLGDEEGHPVARLSGFVDHPDPGGIRTIPRGILTEDAAVFGSSTAEPAPGALEVRAMGVILYLLLGGQMPPPPDSDARPFSELVDDAWVTPDRLMALPEGLRDLLTAMVGDEPGRPSLDVAVDELWGYARQAPAPHSWADASTEGNRLPVLVPVEGVGPAVQVEDEMGWYLRWRAVHDRWGPVEIRTSRYPIPRASQEESTPATSQDVSVSGEGVEPILADDFPWLFTQRAVVVPLPHPGAVADLRASGRVLAPGDVARLGRSVLVAAKDLPRTELFISDRRVVWDETTRRAWLMWWFPDVNDDAPALHRSVTQAFWFMTRYETWSPDDDPDASTVHAVGAVMHVALGGSVPEGEPTPAGWVPPRHHADSPLSTLIRQMTAADPADVPSIDEAIAALSDLID